jgi:hypothetical protein
MAIIGRQMTTTTISSMGVPNGMDCDLCAAGAHHVKCEDLWEYKTTYISYQRLLSDRREDYPPLVFHEIGCGYVHFLNIVQPAKHYIHGNGKVDKPLGTCIMYLTNDIHKRIKARVLTISATML